MAVIQVTQIWAGGVKEGCAEKVPMQGPAFCTESYQTHCALTDRICSVPSGVRDVLVKVNCGGKPKQKISVGLAAHLYEREDAD